eukprot:SAG11_NODE_6521_length_1296_cov_2.232247_3_plen_69_part_00
MICRCVWIAERLENENDTIQSGVTSWIMGRICASINPQERRQFALSFALLKQRSAVGEEQRAGLAVVC